MSWRRSAAIDRADASELPRDRHATLVSGKRSDGTRSGLPVERKINMTGSVTKIFRCEVCGSGQLEPVLDLGSHPMCDDLVPVGDDRRCKEYPIEILFCAQCVTAHQRFQIPKDELFPPSYHYRSRHTVDVLNGMKQLVQACIKDNGSLEGKKILDIGCNDGSLLSIFKDAGAGATFGIEPTDAADDAAERGHGVMKDFLTEDVAKAFVNKFGRPDIITFTNVFAHIDDLQAVVRSLLEISGEDTVIIIENHYLGSIISRNQFDTFYHEHPRTYSFTSFRFIARALNRQVSTVVFPQRYGGNIRVTLKPAAAGGESEAANDAVARERNFGAELKEMARKIAVWKRKKHEQLQAAFTANGGRLSAKAFPGRSAIPVKLLGLDETMLAAVYEKPASGKIGHYVPGTRIPILSDDAFDAAAERGKVVNLAWHIADEIRAYMAERGYRGELIDIISPSDFTDTP
jgi:SAM-dependent methyltransferase